MHARTLGAEPVAVRRRTRAARFSEASGRRAWEAKAAVGRGAGKAEERVAARAGRPTRECGVAAGKAPAAAGLEPASGEAVSRGPGGRRSPEAPRGEAGRGLGPEGRACT